MVVVPTSLEGHSNAPEDVQVQVEALEDGSLVVGPVYDLIGNEIEVPAGARFRLPLVE